jgi:predicted AAA+ superfamily ATPase
MLNDLHKFRVVSAILPAPSSRRIVVLTGARQTGKTTLCKQIYGTFNHINLDSPENRDTLRELATVGWASSVGNAVIDEAQKEPSVFEKVKYAYDEGVVTFTVLTGSSQILLLQKIRESLAGRAYFFELWPLMQCELNMPPDTGGPVEILLDRLILSPSVSDVLEAIPGILLDADDHSYRLAEEHMIRWGGMPALLPLPEQERWQWLKNYSYTYLEGDLGDFARLVDLLPFRKFQKLAALHSGMLLNYSELARDSNVSVDTARRYLEYLNISYQVVLLQPYHKNLTSTVVKTPKLYWTDIGILRQMTGFKGDVTGQFYETMVVGEMVKWIRTRQREVTLYFYRTRSGMEVDLLLETEFGLIGIEMKSRVRVSDKDIRPMREIAERLGKRWSGGMIVYTGKNIFRIAEPNIWAVPSRRLFQATGERPGND